MRREIINIMLLTFSSYFYILPQQCLALDQASISISVAIPYPLEEINPLAIRDPVNRVVVNNLGLGLLRPTAIDLSDDTKSSLEPVLADSYTSENNDTRWIFTLRSGFRFSNASYLSAHRVRQSMIYFKEYASSLHKKQDHNAQKESRFSEELLSALENIESIDWQRTIIAGASTPAEQVVVSLFDPDPHFAFHVGTLAIIDADVATVFADQFFRGTHLSLIGPYQLAENRDGREIHLSNVKLYSDLEESRVNTIKFLYFDNSDLTLSALRGGQVDIIMQATKDQLDRAQKDPTLKIVPSPLLTGEQIIVRKSLNLTAKFLAHFDLSQVN